MPIQSFSTVEDIQVLQFKGPWNSKSGGQLNVLFAIPYEILQAVYFSYDQSELKDVTGDVRGLRSYAVSNVPKGSIGANEWHKIRHELVFATKGSFRWTCEDVQGNKKEFILNAQQGVWTPKYLLHTYEALEDDSTIMVIANTLFNPDDPTTHDSYGIDDFRALQQAYTSQSA